MKEPHDKPNLPAIRRENVKRSRLLAPLRALERPYTVTLAGLLGGGLMLGLSCLTIGMFSGVIGGSISSPRAWLAGTLLAACAALYALGCVEHRARRGGKGGAL